MPARFTVFDALYRVFPDQGPDSATPFPAWPSEEGRGHNGFEGARAKYLMPPVSPFDLFAISGYLLERSGAYHHVVPELSEHHPHSEGAARRLIVISAACIKECRQLAKTWRAELRSGLDGRAALADRRNELWPLVEDWMRLFGDYGLESIFAIRSHLEEPPDWWRLAAKLFIISDEASRSVGFSPDEREQQQPWFERAALFELSKRIRDFVGTAEPTATHRIFSVTWLQSLSAADRDVVSVLPKARTTAVGCTLRSLSHHLALLPPRGVARGQWVPSVLGTPPSDEHELNILLIPFPFTVTQHDFHGRPGYAGNVTRWGYFELTQSWLDAFGPPQARDRMLHQLVEFITELAEVAKREHKAKGINAIVFPEMALDREIFRGLGDKLPQRLPELELLIAGISDKPNRRRGNFVAVMAFQRLGGTPQRERTIQTMGIETIREKHHRWKLDHTQLKAYNLQTVLNPKFEWWEDIDLLSRRVDFTVFRKGSVLAAMICEDLARVDPCQELLRAVGPNIVVALLMDAPQLITRWPARYATILAEDPGSAVLTLTSRGLMTHQHVSGVHTSRSPKDRVIALWRDDFYNRPIELACPPDAHAIWLRVWGSPTTDTTLESREDTSAISWLYGHHEPLRISNADERYSKLLGAEDTNLRRGPSPT